MWCFYHRWRISSALDNGREPPASTQRHTAGCPRCAAFEALGRRMEQALPIAAGAAPQPVGEDMGGASARPRVIPLPIKLGFGALAAAAVILLALVFRGSPPERPPHRAHGNGLAAMDRIGRPSVAGPYLEALAEAQQEALRSEMDNLIADTTAAAETLLAYLPRPADASGREGPSTRP